MRLKATASAAALAACESRAAVASREQSEQYESRLARMGEMQREMQHELDRLRALVQSHGLSLGRDAAASRERNAGREHARSDGGSFPPSIPSPPQPRFGLPVAQPLATAAKMTATGLAAIDPVDMLPLVLGVISLLLLALILALGNAVNSGGKRFASSAARALRRREGGDDSARERLVGSRPLRPYV